MIQRKKQLKNNDDIDLKLFKLWSDRALRILVRNSCIFNRYYINHRNCQCNNDTTPAGHGKTYHDQIGGTTQSHMDRSTINGTFKLKKNGGTKSKQICNFLSSSFSKSKSGDLDRYFIEVPVDMIYTPPKGSKTIDTLDIHGTGITKYHCAYIEANRMRYRALGCCCTTCVNSKYARQCNKTSYCGRWTEYVSVPIHGTYEQLVNDMNNQK